MDTRTSSPAAPPVSRPPLCCEHLCAGYDGVPVVHDVNFYVLPGEHVALIGPNGSGKTTLLRVLDGTLPPLSGKVELSGQDLCQLPPRRRARELAVVPQKKEALPSVSVRDLVLLGRYPYLGWFGRYRAHDYEVVSAVLEETGCSRLADRIVSRLSGGELQRVLLARALAQEGRILLLDELTAGLDIARMIELFELLDARRAAGVALVTVVHDLNLAALYADRLVALKQGRIICEGAVADVFTDACLSELFDTRIHTLPHPRRSVPQICLDRNDLWR